MMTVAIKNNAKRRVVVTGMGAVTPLGQSLDATWNGIIEGISVAGPVTAFDSAEFPTRIAYEVKDFCFDDSLVVPRERYFLSRAGEFGVTAAAAALVDAGLRLGQRDDRMGVCLGVGMCSPEYQWYDQVFIPKRFDSVDMGQHVRFFPDQLSSIVARLAGAGAGVTTIHTACASSGQALGEAYEQIAYGDVDVVLTGGADAMVQPYYLAGFGLLGALSKRNDDPKTASRPFDKGREGFVLGEGACMLVFEDYDRAVARGARIYAEVCGYGITESAYRITDLHPSGRGPIEAMEMAVADAGIEACAVGYVNAHGTSTPLNDRIEGVAITRVFGKQRTQVSSTKSMTGHMISAAGAIEFAVCVKALEHQVLPPSVNIFDADPECGVTLTSATPEAASLQYALSNSVGFGGSNTALVAGRIG